MSNQKTCPNYLVGRGLTSTSIFWGANLSLITISAFFMEQSSATAAVDPDRQTIQYFENGGANPMKDSIEIVPFSRPQRLAALTPY